MRCSFHEPGSSGRQSEYVNRLRCGSSRRRLSRDPEAVTEASLLRQRQISTFTLPWYPFHWEYFTSRKSGYLPQNGTCDTPPRLQPFNLKDSQRYPTERISLRIPEKYSQRMVLVSLKVTSRCIYRNLYVQIEAGADMSRGNQNFLLHDWSGSSQCPTNLKASHADLRELESCRGLDDYKQYGFVLLM